MESYFFERILPGTSLRLDNTFTLTPEFNVMIPFSPFHGWHWKRRSHLSHQLLFSHQSTCSPLRTFHRRRRCGCLLEPSSQRMSAAYEPQSHWIQSGCCAVQSRTQGRTISQRTYKNSAELSSKKGLRVMLRPARLPTSGKPSSRHSLLQTAAVIRSTTRKQKNIIIIIHVLNGVSWRAIGACALSVSHLPTDKHEPLSTPITGCESDVHWGRLGDGDLVHNGTDPGHERLMRNLAVHRCVQET